MKRRRFSWLLSVLVGGCAAPLHTVSTAGEPYLWTTSAPVGMVAHGGQWPGNALPPTVIPVAVELYNGGRRPVRVSYEDFEMVNDQGVRYAPMNPFWPASPDSGITSAGSDIELRPTANHGIVVTPASCPIEEYVSAAVPPPKEPLLYWKSVLPWVPSGEEIVAASDVKGHALVEGTLAPGARVTGFLYFLRASVAASALSVHWATPR